MKRIATVPVVALLLHTSTLLAANAPDDSQRLFVQVSPSVVTVQTLDAQGKPAGQGSGVVVGSAQVVTNCHVVEEAAAIQVIAAQGELPAVWTHQLADLDLCLLSVAGLKAAPAQLRLGASLVVGEPAFAIGNPLGFGLAVSAGLIAITTLNASPNVLLATAPVSPGSSGGGLFDTQGQLLGITTAIMGSGQNLNRVVTTDGVRTLLAHGTPRPPITLPPVPERRWSDESEALQNANQWAALEQLAQAWAQAQPKVAEAFARQGIAQYNLNRNSEAEANLRQALVLDPNLGLAWINLAQVLFLQERLEEADQALRQIERRQPGYSGADKVRAEWFWKQGKPAQALEPLKAAIRKEPALANSWGRLGEVEDKLGHFPQAATAFATAQRLTSPTAQSGGANATVGHSVAKGVPDSQEAQLLVNLAFSEIRQNRIVQAEDAVRKAMVLAPNSGPVWNAQGALDSHMKRWAQADAAFTQALGFNPRDASTLSNRAEARRAMKKLALALEDAKQATEIDPTSSAAWRAYAVVNHELRDYRNADAAFAKLVALGPLSAENMTAWSESLLGIGKPDEALSTLQKAEVQDPKLVNLYLVKAKILGQKGDLAGALAAENQALALDPVNAHAWSGKGYAMVKLGKLPEAAEALETAVQLDPNLANAWINLGEAQMRNGNLGRAIQALETATSLAPDAMDARMLLAQSYLNARLPAKARDQAEKVLARQPNMPMALGLVAFTYLMETNPTAASVPYLKLKTLAPDIARKLRDQAMASGLVAAAVLPE